MKSVSLNMSWLMNGVNSGKILERNHMEWETGHILT